MELTKDPQVLLGEISKILKERRLVPLVIESWIILQRDTFDSYLSGEPHQVIRLWIDCQTGRFLHRLWGKTTSTGCFNGHEDLEHLIASTFIADVPYEGEPVTDLDVNSIQLFQSTAKRSVSKTCLTSQQCSYRLYEVKEEDTTKNDEDCKTFENEAEVVSCRICDKKTDSVEQYFEHHFTCHKDWEFNCPLCFKTVFTKDKAHEFLEHFSSCLSLKVQRDRDKRLERKTALRHVCDYCGKVFLKKRYLFEHLNRHQGIKHLKCDECNFETCYDSSLYTHRLRHKREKGMFASDRTNLSALTCDKCSKTFSRLGILKQHQRIVHEGIKDVHTCERCGLTFLNRSQWRRHNLREHSGAPRHTCPECRTTFVDQYDLTIHARVHKAPEFVCRFCGKAVKSSQALEAHERQHTGETPFECDLCSYACKASSVLSKHKSLKHKTKKKEAAVLLVNK